MKTYFQMSIFISLLKVKAVKKQQNIPVVGFID